MKKTKTPEPKFYTFRQNNSGGSFDYDETRGISVWVVVEAFNEADANNRAENIGLYFDGEGDCSCCGDRWSTAWENSAADIPSDGYGPNEKGEYRHVKDTIEDRFGLYAGFKYPAMVHFLNGKIVGYGSEGSKTLRKKFKDSDHDPTAADRS